MTSGGFLAVEMSRQWVGSPLGYGGACYKLGESGSGWGPGGGGPVVVVQWWWTPPQSRQERAGTLLPQAATAG